MKGSDVPFLSRSASGLHTVVQYSAFITDEKCKACIYPAYQWTKLAFQLIFSTWFFWTPIWSLHRTQCSKTSSSEKAEPKNYSCSLGHHDEECKVFIYPALAEDQVCLELMLHFWEGNSLFHVNMTLRSNKILQLAPQRNHAVQLNASKIVLLIAATDQILWAANWASERIRDPFAP